MFKKKFLLSAVSVATLIAPSMIEKAQAEETTTWQARSVDQVLTDVIYNDDKAEYTIQPGDTISVIAEALEIDLEILAEIDVITNAELMTPGVELTAQYDEQHNVEVITLESTDGTVTAFDVSAGYPQAIEVKTSVTTAATVQPVEEWIETEEAPVIEDTVSEVSETDAETLEVLETVIQPVNVEPVEEWDVDEVAEVEEAEKTEEVAEENTELEANDFQVQASTDVEEETETEVSETDAEVSEASVTQLVNVEPVQEWTDNEIFVAEETEEVTEETTEQSADTVQASIEVVESPETEVAGEISAASTIDEQVEDDTLDTTITTTETVESVEGIPATEEVEQTISAGEEVVVEEISEETFEYVEPEFEVIEEEPVTEEPVYEEPVSEEPVYEEPVYEEPAVEENYDPYANPGNAGLTEDAARFKDDVANKFGVTSFSTVRPGDPGDHGTGRAVDFMVEVGSQLGDDIANYSTSNMAENNISYVIWEQQIYGDWNHQWTPMEDRGSITENHYDHVHVSFY